MFSGRDGSVRGGVNAQCSGVVACVVVPQRTTVLRFDFFWLLLSKWSDWHSV